MERKLAAAVEELEGVTGDQPPPELYLRLHARILDLALDRGLLKFADEIVAAIPPQACGQEPFASLLARFEALKEVDVYGAYLPSYLIEPNWWLREPPLIRRRLSDMVLEEWLACRVDGVDPEQCFSVRAARVVVGRQERPQVVSATLPWEKLESWSVGNVEEVDVGGFIVSSYPHQALPPGPIPGPHRSWAETDSS